MAYTNPIWESDSDFNYIMETALAFRKSKILFTAIELDIFNKIGAKGQSVSDLALATNSDVLYLERFLNALVSLKFLVKHDNLYLNSEVSGKHLVHGAKDYLGNLKHVAELWEPWSRLTESIVQGSPVVYQELDEKSDEWISNFVESTYWTRSMESRDVISGLHIGKINKFLDLGGGSGYFAMQVLDQKPGVQAYVFDYPKIIKQTERILKEKGYDGKINAIGGDFQKDDFGSDYDMILVSSVLNYYSVWDNIKLLQKAYNSIKPGGFIAVHQRTLCNCRTKPESSTLEAVNLLVNTNSGSLYTNTDVWVMLKEAWFQNVEKKETEFGTTITIGVKPVDF